VALVARERPEAAVISRTQRELDAVVQEIRALAIGVGWAVLHVRETHDALAGRTAPETLK